LCDHVAGLCLDFEVLYVAGGEVVEMKNLERQIGCMACIEWVRSVHCETSTGVLNDISALVELCWAKGIKLYVDEFSTIDGCYVDFDIQCKTRY
jgi:aspartate aminotransferase-like enzyme